MKLAERISRISPSITLGLNARTLELKAQGRDIIAFGVGEPDINTPLPVCEAAKQAIDDCVVRYTATAGTPELRQAICGYVESTYGLKYGTDCVMASAGGKQVLYNSILATAGKGDEFILPLPYWTSYPEFVSLADADLVLVETTAENQFKMTPEGLEKAITPRSTALLLNSPSNPTGVAYSRSDLEELAEVLAPHDIWILSDDIYCALLFDGHEFVSFAQLPGFKDRTIIINGVSKTWSMTGWRIGFAAGPREVIAGMTKIQDHSTSCPNAIGQKAAAEALRRGHSLTAEWVSSLGARRDLMLSLATAIPGVTAVEPQGAFYLFVDVGAYLGRAGGPTSTLELADGLLVDGGVGTIPCEAFGAPGYLRLSFAVTEENIREGIRRMSNYLTSI